MLQELIRLDPRNANLQGSLAIAYGDTATWLAKSGHPSKALEYVNRGVELMRSRVASDPKNAYDTVLPQSTPTTLAEYVNEELAVVFGGAYPPLFNAYGYAIDTSVLSQNLQSMLPGIVNAGVDTRWLFFNEAGITIDALNVRLDNQSPRVAISTLGGSAGQTIAGAISTGTHGSDFDRPPIADCVRALYIIGAGERIIGSNPSRTNSRTRRRSPRPSRRSRQLTVTTTTISSTQRSSGWGLWG